MKSKIPYSTQTIDNNDIKNVIKVLKSDYLTQGPILGKFEKAISKFCKSKYALGVNSATSALYLACAAINFKKKDILWTTPNTFVGTSNCALHLGGKVDFVDIDYIDGNIDILDIVMIVNFILLVNQPDDNEFYLSDFNSDNQIDVLDLTELINFILQ